MPPKQTKEEERKEKLTKKQKRLDELDQAATERKASGYMGPMPESERKERDTLKTTIKNLNRTGEDKMVFDERNRDKQKTFQREKRKKIKEQEELLNVDYLNSAREMEDRTNESRMNTINNNNNENKNENENFFIERDEFKKYNDDFKIKNQIVNNQIKYYSKPKRPINKPGREMRRDQMMEYDQRTPFEAPPEEVKNNVFQRPKLIKPGREMRRDQMMEYDQRTPFEAPPEEVKNNVFQRPKLIKPGRDMRRDQMMDYEPQPAPNRYSITPEEFKITNVYQRPKLIKPGRDMRRDQMNDIDFTQPYIMNEGKYESREYDDIKEIKREIDEAKMLSGGDHATLFNGDTLNMSANQDTADAEKHDNGGTESGLERYRGSKRDTDIPDLSNFDFNDYAMAGGDVLPTRGSINDFESDFRQRSNNSKKSIYSAFSGDYAGSQESLLSNGYGRPAMPQFNNRKNESKYEQDYKEGHDSEVFDNQRLQGLNAPGLNAQPLSDIGDNGSIMSEISNHINLRDDSMDSTDNKPTMEDLIRRMKGVNRTNTNFKDFKKKQKWNPTTGRGNKLKGIKTMSNSLSSIREAQIPYKQPNRSYKGDAVNLVRMGNSTITKIINQYQP